MGAAQQRQAQEPAAQQQRGRRDGDRGGGSQAVIGKAIHQEISTRAAHRLKDQGVDGGEIHLLPGQGAGVQGEGGRCGSLAELQQRMLEINQQSAISPGAPGQSAIPIGVVDHPLCRAAVGGVDQTQLAWVDSSWDREGIAKLALSVLPAEFLLADTGTAVVVARSPAERLLCYLPTVAVLVAQAGNLVAHMSDVWNQVVRHIADPATRGEVVLVTGPSRTADIEKKLVLGAHGPKRLIVMLVEWAEASHGPAV